MLKLFVCVIICCLLSVLIRQYCKEFLLLFQLGFSLIVVLFVLDDSSDTIVRFIDVVDSISADNESLSVLLRAGLVSVLGKLGADVCKESGNHLLESIIELAVKLMIFVMSMPYILKIINIAIEYL